MYWRAATAASSAVTVSAEAPEHWLAALMGLPENGSTRPPSRTVLNQRVSLSCWLSARSPVVSTKPSLARLPLPSLTGLVRLALTLRTVASNTGSSNASIGRQADFSSPPAGSMKSTRAGDISSAICGSVSWAKKASDRRVFARFFFACPRTTYASPGLATSPT